MAHVGGACSGWGRGGVRLALEGIHLIHFNESVPRTSEDEGAAESQSTHCSIVTNKTTSVCESREGGRRKGRGREEEGREMGGREGEREVGERDGWREGGREGGREHN